MMGDGGVKQILAKPIQLADQVSKWADNAYSFKQECMELKAKTERLAGLLRQAARAELYERPTRRIMNDTEQVLDKALALVLKCRANGVVGRLFTIMPAAAFKKMSTQLDNSIGDVSWLIRVSSPPVAGSDDGDIHLGLPPSPRTSPSSSSSGSRSPPSTLAPSRPGQTPPPASYLSPATTTATANLSSRRTVPAPSSASSKRAALKARRAPPTPLASSPATPTASSRWCSPAPAPSSPWSSRTAP